jgi:hypothetical protein
LRTNQTVVWLVWCTNVIVRQNQTPTPLFKNKKERSETVYFTFFSRPVILSSVSFKAFFSLKNVHTSWHQFTNIWTWFAITWVQYKGIYSMTITKLRKGTSLKLTNATHIKEASLHIWFYGTRDILNKILFWENISPMTMSKREWIKPYLSSISSILAFQISSFFKRLSLSCQQKHNINICNVIVTY